MTNRSAEDIDRLIEEWENGKVRSKIEIDKHERLLGITKELLVTQEEILAALYKEKKQLKGLTIHDLIKKEYELRKQTTLYLEEDKYNEKILIEAVKMKQVKEFVNRMIKQSDTKIKEATVDMDENKIKYWNGVRDNLFYFDRIIKSTLDQSDIYL